MRCGIYDAVVRCSAVGYIRWSENVVSSICVSIKVRYCTILYDEKDAIWYNTILELQYGELGLIRYGKYGVSRHTKCDAIQ